MTEPADSAPACLPLWRPRRYIPPWTETREAELRQRIATLALPSGYATHGGGHQSVWLAPEGLAADTRARARHVLARPVYVTRWLRLADASDHGAHREWLELAWEAPGKPPMMRARIVSASDVLNAAKLRAALRDDNPPWAGGPMVGVTAYILAAWRENYPVVAPYGSAGALETVDRIADPPLPTPQLQAAIDVILGERFNGRRAADASREQRWAFDSPRGGEIIVRVRLGKRWCGITVDRWNAGGYPGERLATWLRENVWPDLWGGLPGGTGDLAIADRVERARMPQVLAGWIERELVADATGGAW